MRWQVLVGASLGLALACCGATGGRVSPPEVGLGSRPGDRSMAPGDRLSAPRYRAADLGLWIGDLPRGALNAITDVEGVRVGHCDVREAGRFCTGVTAVLPHAGNLFQDKVRAAVFTGNGFGKLVGTTQVTELGSLETPILLTGTLSTFRVADALVSWMLALPGNEEVRSINPVVGETNDGFLSDVRARPVEPAHVFAALDGASAGPVAEGCVGAGVGTRCLGFKGGIGSASRVVSLESGDVTVGVLVQTNFGGTLRVQGVEVPASRFETEGTSAGAGSRDGSCMIVVATDAPLDARQLGRVARRAVYGLGRVGADYSHGSGDYAIAFSTVGVASDRRVDDAILSPLFRATLDAVEEAVLNSMLQATTTEGFAGRRVAALPAEPLVRWLREHGVPAVWPPDLEAGPSR